MKRLCLLLLFVVCPVLVASAAPGKTLQGKVIAVADGDTLTILVNKKPVRVRLYGIDCPEMAQPFGEQAKQFTSVLTFDKMATVYTKGIGRDGITAGWLFIGATCVNRELVSGGLAWWDQASAPAESKLDDLEQRAREAKVGLWSDNAPIAPWEWRRGASVTGTQANHSQPTQTQEPAGAEPAAAVVQTRPGPDLIISRVAFKPERPQVGEPIQAYIYYKNIGDQRAAGFYLALEENGAGGEGFGGGALELAPGEEKEYLWGAIAARAGGKFTLRFTADPTNKVAESNEQNNGLDIVLTVVP